MKQKSIFAGFMFILSLTLLLVPVQISQAGPRAQSPIEDEMLKAFEAEAYPISAVQIEGQSVQLTYHQSALQDQTTLPFAYLDVLMLVAEHMPEAERVSMNVSYLGEPFFELSANGSELRALVAEEISAAEFLSDINFIEQRTLDTLLRNEFSARGYPYDGYLLESSNLYIPVTAARLQPEQMVEAAVELASVAVTGQDNLSQITLGFTGANGREVQFMLPAQHAASYAAGEQSMLEAITSLEINEPAAVRQRSPLLGRFLGVVELGLAGMAAAFYGISAARLRSWSLALKAGALVVLPALIAGAIMLILMW